MIRKLPYNLTYLKYFCDAVKFGGISISAEKNFVTQSAVSQAISKLEKSLQVNLITHQPNQFRPTDEGEMLNEKAKELFRTFSKLEAAFDDYAEEERGHVEFACTHSFALAVLPNILKKFKRAKPHVQVTFHLGHTDSIKIWLRQGMIDFGFVLDNENFSAFEIQEIYHGEHHLYRRKTISPESTLPLLLSEERAETLKLKEHYRKRYHEELAVDMEISSWEVIANLVEEGMGIGFFPDYVARKKSKLEVWDLDLPSIPYRLLAISPRSLPLSHATVSFLQAVKKDLSA